MPKKANALDLIVKQPVPTLNKKINFNFKKLFINLGKIAIATKAGNPATALRHVMDLFKAAKLENNPEWVAWMLISQALSKTLIDLVEDYKDLFQKELTEAEFELVASSAEESLNKLKVTINADFFKQPQKLALLDEIKTGLIPWLKEFGWDDAQAEAFHDRMKSSFVFALNDIWASNPEDFKILEERLKTPFTDASVEQRNWIRYNASLATLSNERVFNEAFSLKQVYVPLNAYYKETVKDDDNKKIIQIAFDLHDYINNWVTNFDKEDALKVIRGGPGCGKSSFSKMLVAEIAEKGEVPVLFIPLHQFDPTKDLTQAVDDFISYKEFSVINPLDTKNGQDRLLIVFDGLDELSMKSQASSEVANNFVQEVSNVLHRFNSAGKIKRQAIITGRDIAIQGSEQRLRKSQQILHMLPYYLDEEEQEEYKDSENRLSKDLRDTWWHKFGKAKGKSYKKIPIELKTNSLTPITKEPLLNYLVALSYQREQVDFNENTTLNTIYKDLLDAVYERQWGDDDQHKMADDLTKPQFFRILEEIALAVWHGHGRTASQSAIYKRCADSGLKTYLDKFSDGAEKGVVRLLTAFYFREFGQELNGDPVFEFTHKSFGEYLTARRIVLEVRNIQDEVERHQKNPDKGYNIRQALEVWARICGKTAMDKYLFGFVKDEIVCASNHENDIKKWQETFAEMLGSSVRETMPMESLGLGSFGEMLRQSLNANEGILAVYNSCFSKTKEVIYINWGDELAFGSWWKMLHRKKRGIYTVLSTNLLSGLNLNDCDLNFSDFFMTVLSDSTMTQTQLIRVSFTHATLNHANLKFASLNSAGMRNCQLLSVNLEEADLESADMREANLKGANLKGANLKGVNLEGANLEGTNFEGADLEGADLEGAKNIETANFKDANIKGTILEKE